MPNNATPTPPDRGRTLLAWSFPEFIRYNRSRTWYIVVGVIGGALLLFAIFTRNFLFAVILVIVAIIIGLRMNRQPRPVNVAINEQGFVVGESFFSFKELKHFWIAYEPPTVKKLYVEFQSGVRPALSISLESQNPLAVRDLLLKFLPEDQTQEDELLADRLSRLFKI